MKEFEKKLIGENKHEASNKIYHTLSGAEKLNTFRDRLENIGLSWNMDTIQDILQHQAVQSESYLLGLIEQEVDRCVIPARRDQLRQELKDSFMGDFKQLRMEMKEAASKCEHKYLSMVDGKVVLSPEGLEEIEEAHKIYATTPEEWELWNEITDLCDRMNRLDAKLKPFGIYAVTEYSLNVPSVISIYNGKPEANCFTLKQCHPASIWAGKRV